MQKKRILSPEKLLSLLIRARAFRVHWIEEHARKQLREHYGIRISFASEKEVPK